MTQTSITRSWVASANGHADFPLQNLPLGVFSVKGAAPRSGVAIGDQIFDLEAALDAGLFDGRAKSAVEATRGGQLNAFFELGRDARVALRERLLELFAEGSTLRGKIEAQGAKLLPRPPMTNVGSRPPAANTEAIRLVVVVLPWVPATAMPWR